MSPARPASLDSKHLRQWCSGFATGVAVITLKDKTGARRGITVNSLTSVSLDPPLMLFCLARSAGIAPAFRAAPRFAINILAEDQEALSRHFANPQHNPAPDDLWERDRRGCPILHHTLGWMVCEKTAIHRGGDHDILVGRTVALLKRSTNPKPLLYFHSRYRRLGE